MGRELKRVPLDFDWPIDEIWDGYLSPDWRPCPADHCGRGYTTAEHYIEGIATLLDLVGQAAFDTSREPHPWLKGIPVAYGESRPSPDIADIIKAIAPDWVPSGMLMGGSHAIARALIALGPEDWGTCKTCGGHGIHPDDIEASEAWEPTEPPEGAGYQMWGTTSEGNPMTPVFTTLDELAAHCAEHCTTFADHTASAEGWKQMLGDGFVAATVLRPDGTQVTFI